MADIFLSKGHIAEELSQAIKSLGGDFSQISNIDDGKTNLDVIAKMVDVCENLETINNAYKELLSKDATAITLPPHQLQPQQKQKKTVQNYLEYFQTITDPYHL